MASRTTLWRCGSRWVTVRVRVRVKVRVKVSVGVKVKFNEFVQHKGGVGCLGITLRDHPLG